MMKYLGILFYTEWVLKFRASQQWIYPLCFFVIVVSLFPLSISSDETLIQKFIPGFIWIAALLASLLSVENIFSVDIEEGYLEEWIRSDHSFTVILYVKLFVHWVATQVPLILLVPLLGVLFHLSSATMFLLLLTLLIGSPILTLLGAFVTALTLSLDQRGILLGLLFLPLVIPVLIFGVNIINAYLAGFNIQGSLLFFCGISLLTISTLPWVIGMVIKEFVTSS